MGHYAVRLLSRLTRSLTIKHREYAVITWLGFLNVAKPHSVMLQAAINTDYFRIIRLLIVSRSANLSLGSVGRATATAGEVNFWLVRGKRYQQKYWFQVMRLMAEQSRELVGFWFGLRGVLEEDRCDFAGMSLVSACRCRGRPSYACCLLRDPDVTYVHQL